MASQDASLALPSGEDCVPGPDSVPGQDREPGQAAVAVADPAISGQESTDHEPVAYVADLLYPVRVLGPGSRIGIWFSGCSRRCHNCVSPDLQRRRREHRITLQSLLGVIRELASRYPVDGFTLSGGEPFEQPGILRLLLPELEQISGDILIYTGYLCARLREMGCGDILEHTGVLVDGPYIDRLNRNTFLRGSANQQILILKEELRDLYAPYLAGGINRLQVFSSRGGFVTVGIVRQGFAGELADRLRARGVIREDRSGESRESGDAREGLSRDAREGLSRDAREIGAGQQTEQNRNS